MDVERWESSCYLLLFVLALAVIFCCATAQCATYRHDGAAVLNDLSSTPGALNPALSKAKICDPSFRTGAYRHTTEAEKKSVCLEYGASDCPNPKKGEIDHLVPLYLGGADVVANLWWQPASPVPGYHQKDLVEVWAHRQVCSGNADLSAIQKQMREDWFVLYRQMKSEGAK